MSCIHFLIFFFYSNTLYLRLVYLCICIITRYNITNVCDKVCQWLATGRWFSLETPVSSTNKTDCHDITEILLKVELNTIILTLNAMYNDFQFDNWLHIYVMQVYVNTEQFLSILYINSFHYHKYFIIFFFNITNKYISSYPDKRYFKISTMSNTSTLYFGTWNGPGECLVQRKIATTKEQCKLK